MVLKGKRGMMDDFFDLVFTIVILFFALFFIQVVLNGDVESKQDISFKRMELFNNQELFLYYLNYPLSVEGTEMRMKDLILLAVNRDSEELFNEKNKEFFELRGVKGRVNVYDSKQYEEEGSSLFYYSNVGFTDKEKQVMKLSNLGGQKIYSVTIVSS